MKAKLEGCSYNYLNYSIIAAVVVGLPRLHSRDGHQDVECRGEGDD